MLLVALLFGFAPREGAVQSGPDTHPLPVSPAIGASPARVAAFRDAWGAWTVRWDDRNGTPRALIGPGAPYGAKDALLADVARLGAIDPATLVFERARVHGDRTGYRFQQTWRGAPVEFGTVDLVAQNGKISYITANLHRVDLTDEPRPGERVLPREDAAGKLTYTLVTRAEEGADTVYRDRAGVEVHRYSNAYPLDVTFHDREPSGPLVSAPAREISVSDGVNLGLTDAFGDTPLTGTLAVRLDGPWLTMRRNGLVVLAPAVDDGVLDTGVDLAPSAAAELDFQYDLRDWLTLRDPAHPYLAADIDVAVDVNGTCNAYYSFGSVNFYEEGGGCAPTAQLADVVYHENGHGIHDYGLVAGRIAGDVGEGSADFVSATMNDDPNIAVGFFGPGTVLREIATNAIWPQDKSFDTHVTGLIWAGTWWDIREDFVAQLGYDAGTALADTDFLATLALGPAITDWEAILAGDDDDGDLSNGTPNACTLLTHASEHGLSPSPFVLVDAVLTPVGDQPSGHPTDPPTPVHFALEGVGATCTDDLDLDSVRLWYAVDADPTDAIADIAFTEVVPTRVDSTYDAAIPPQPAGTHVVYYLSWSNADGSLTVETHHGVTQNLYQYWVGDQAGLWCDDFEAGLGDWTTDAGALDGGDETGGTEFEVGVPPADRAWGATSAYSPTQVLGQRLTDGRVYRTNNEQHATSPEIDLADANHSLLILGFQRWLTVDAGSADPARVLESTLGTLWQNPPQNALLDDGWTEQRFDVLALMQDDVGTAQVSFTLATDGNTGYDGWNLDDVCLYTLADAPRHYRGSALVASDDDADAVTVTWTEPWVKPLFATKLVRRQGGVPADPTDGETVYTTDGPTPGAPGQFVDTDVKPGETWTYALFAADVDGHWYDAATGENADDGTRTGGPSGTTGTDTTADGGATDGDEKGGCGCANTGAVPAGWLGLGVAAALAARRRKAV